MAKRDRRVKHAAFLFNPADYWLDTFDLTDAQHGIYLRLLMLLWNTPRCRIPHDDAWIASKMTRSLEAFEKEVKPLLLRFCKTDGNSWWQGRLMAEYERLDRLSARGTAGGKALAKKKKDLSQTPARNTKQAHASSLSPEAVPLILTSCSSALSKNLSEEESISVVTIPILGTGEFVVSQTMAAEFSKSYPAVDVLQELRAMRAWSISNPTHRKTQKGMMRFINGWLAKTQNRSKPNGHGKSTNNDNWLAGAADLAAELRNGK